MWIRVNWVSGHPFSLWVLITWHFEKSSTYVHVYTVSVSSLSLKKLHPPCWNVYVLPCLRPLKEGNPLFLLLRRVAFVFQVCNKIIFMISFVGNRGTFTRGYKAMVLEVEFLYHLLYLIICSLGVFVHVFFYSLLVRDTHTHLENTHILRIL